MNDSSLFLFVIGVVVVMLWPDGAAAHPKKTWSQTHMLRHMQPVTHLSLLLLVEFHHSLALLWNPAHQSLTCLVVPYICRLAWQPSRPHASRGVTFAPLFVSQNNIRSPVVFLVPHPFLPCSTHCPLDSILWQHQKHLTQWLDLKEKYIDSCVMPAWSCYVPHETAYIRLWKSLMNEIV